MTLQKEKRERSNERKLRLLRCSSFLGGITSLCRWFRSGFFSWCSSRFLDWNHFFFLLFFFFIFTRVELSILSTNSTHWPVSMRQLTSGCLPFPLVFPLAAVLPFPFPLGASDAKEWSESPIMLSSAATDQFLFRQKRHTYTVLVRIDLLPAFSFLNISAYDFSGELTLLSSRSAGRCSAH